MNFSHMKNLLPLRVVTAAAITAMCFSLTACGSKTFQTKEEEGLNISFQIVEDSDKQTADALEQTQDKLTSRAKKFSEDAIVSVDENHQITIHIPGVTNENADEVVNTLTASHELYFCSKVDSIPTKDQLEKKEYLQLKDKYAGSYKIWLSGESISECSGENITDNMTGLVEYVVSLTFDEDGAKLFGDMTTENIGQQTYIVYDGEVISAPMVQQAITGGKAQISGMASLEDAQELAENIRLGSLPLTLKEVARTVTEPKE